MRALFGLVSLTLLLHSGAAYAQYAPVPKKSPRTPVKSHALVNNEKKIPASRLLQGQAQIINTQTLNLKGFKLRLFGIVPPFLGASYGPQTRAVLDQLTQGTTNCKILDRGRDGFYLARCSNETNQDFGLELLRRGLAVTARGSLKQTDIERNYIAAEQTAQTSRIGLWSMTVPKGASNKSIQDQATKMVHAKIAQAAAQKAKAVAQQDKLKAQKEKEATKTVAPAETTQTTVSLASGQIKNSLAPQQPISPTLTADEILAALSQPPLDQSEVITPTTEKTTFTSGSFWERFQFMITGLIILGAALIVTISVALQKELTRREDRRAVAAALRGELMAARSICRARLSKIEDQHTEDNVSWPRIRTLVFQAYVGRLGNLGSDLSRQIASIYGQAADYASYYRSHNGKDTASKQKALEALVHHIDEVNPRLAQIEQSGVHKPMPIKTPYSQMKLGNAQKKNNLSLPTTQKTCTKSKSKKVQAAPFQDKASMAAPAAVQTCTSKQTISQSMAKAMEEAKKEINTPIKPLEDTSDNNKQTVVIQAAKEDKAASMVNFAAPIFEKLSSLKDKATTRTERRYKSSNEFDIPDYGNLTEEEIEDLLSAEEERMMATSMDKSQAG